MSFQKDLVVLVADKNMNSALEGILQRNIALGIKEITFDIFVHFHRDPGCRSEGHLFLQPFCNVYHHAIVMFDRDGCGQKEKNRQALEDELEFLLRSNGWDDRATVIVLDPELEVWVWADSPHVNDVLGWKSKDISMLVWLQEKGYIKQGHPFPPKEAMESLLKFVRKPRSSSIYLELAQKVSYKNCNETSFVKLRECLKNWFPIT